MISVELKGFTPSDAMRGTDEFEFSSVTRHYLHRLIPHHLSSPRVICRGTVSAISTPTRWAQTRTSYEMPATELLHRV